MTYLSPASSRPLNKADLATRPLLLIVDLAKAEQEPGELEARWVASRPAPFGGAA